MSNVPVFVWVMIGVVVVAGAFTIDLWWRRIGAYLRRDEQAQRRSEDAWKR